MSYAEMLDRIIKESELSLRQISKRCGDLNLQITPSYISQLKNGKLPPPSEDVSLVLAKVCGAKNHAHLVFQGYMEKAPKLMREYMLAASSLNKALLESLCKNTNQPFSKDMEEYVKSLDILSALDLSSKYVSADDPAMLRDLIGKIAIASGELTAADTQGEMQTLFHGDHSMSPAIPLDRKSTRLNSSH